MVSSAFRPTILSNGPAVRSDISSRTDFSSLSLPTPSYEWFAKARLNRILGTMRKVSVSRAGLDRDRNLLAFGTTFDDGTQGLYKINVFTGLRVTSMAKVGADLGAGSWLRSSSGRDVITPLPT